MLRRSRQKRRFYWLPIYSYRTNPASQDYLNPQNANLLPGTLVDVDKKSNNGWMIKESKRFKVSYSLAKDKMKYIYQNRKNEKVIQKAVHVVVAVKL